MQMYDCAYLHATYLTSMQMYGCAAYLYTNYVKHIIICMTVHIYTLHKLFNKYANVPLCCIYMRCFSYKHINLCIIVHNYTLLSYVLHVSKIRVVILYNC